MRIIFMGTPDFAVPALETLVKSSFEPVLVVTGEDKPRGRGQQLLPTPVKKTALKYWIPVYQPKNLNSPEVIEELKEYRADLFVVVAFRILPEQIIVIPGKGVFNLHASLLPKYRGAAPIQWALLNGEKKTGVTTFFIEKKVDTGDIILQKPVEIYPDDNAGTLHDKLSETGAQLVLESVNLIVKGSFSRQKQVGEATNAPKITREMCQINWTAPWEQVINQIRAFSPYPGAFTGLENSLVKIFKAGPAPFRDNSPPGYVGVDGYKLFSSTGDGWIEILELQLQGKKRMSAEKFLQGRSFGKKAVFEDIE